MRLYLITLACVFLIPFSTIAVIDQAAADESAPVSEEESIKQVSHGIQALKKNVINLNKDLRLIEEALLFPSSTKFTVFLSLDAGKFFTLESVKLVINGKTVNSHVYSDRQRQALARGSRL